MPKIKQPRGHSTSTRTDLVSSASCAANEAGWKPCGSGAAKAVSAYATSTEAAACCRTGAPLAARPDCGTGRRGRERKAAWSPFAGWLAGLGIVGKGPPGYELGWSTDVCLPEV